MSDGYIEDGTELLTFIKSCGLSDHDVDAVEALDGIMKDLVKEFAEQRIKPERKIRRAYGTGFIHGIKLAADVTKMNLRKLRHEQGLDPDTGEKIVRQN
jgi:hypothetical protein